MARVSWEQERRRLRLKAVVIPFFFVVAITCFPVSGLPQTSRVPRHPAGISQLIENRGGRVSCWGVIVQLGNLRFRDRIKLNQVSVREAKHGHELKEMMTWRVDRSGRRLTIEFKRGMGDFGSGNAVEIQIDRSALIEPGSSGSNHFRWSIDTDVL